MFAKDEVNLIFAVMFNFKRAIKDRVKTVAANWQLTIWNHSTDKK